MKRDNQKPDVWIDGEGWRLETTEEYDTLVTREGLSGIEFEPRFWRIFWRIDYHRLPHTRCQKQRLESNHIKLF